MAVAEVLEAAGENPLKIGIVSNRELGKDVFGSAEKPVGHLPLNLLKVSLRTTEACHHKATEEDSKKGAPAPGVPGVLEELLLLFQSL